MAGREQRHLDTIDVERHPKFQYLKAAGTIVPVAGFHDGGGIGGRQHRAVPGPRMIGMAVRDDGAGARHHRIDVDIDRFNTKIAVEKAHFANIGANSGTS